MALNESRWLLVAAITALSDRIVGDPAAPPGRDLNGYLRSWEPIMAGSKGSQGRRLAGAGALVAVLTICAYLVVVLSEGNNSAGRIVLWSGAMAVGAASLCVAASARGRQTASWFALVGTVLLAALGVVSLFSVGVALLTAAALGLAAVLSLRNRSGFSHP